jgi:hypothetical protein
LRNDEQTVVFARDEIDAAPAACFASRFVEQVENGKTETSRIPVYLLTLSYMII